jgi:hypothetical protein
MANATVDRFAAVIGEGRMGPFAGTSKIAR